MVLPSLVLAGWLTAASAQDVGAGNAAPQPGLVQSSDPQASAAAATDENAQSTLIPVPTLDAPGLVVGVKLGELYTDNLTVAGRGQASKSSWITQVEPFVRAAASTPRFSGSVNYRLMGYLYGGRSNADQLAQYLDARGTLTLVPERFFLDGTALYQREIVNNAQPSGSGAFFLDNNHVNVARGTLSPYWVQDLGRVGTMVLRYIRGRVVYNHRGIPRQARASLGGIPDATSNAVQFSVASPRDQQWGWDLGYTEQRLQPDFGSSVDFAMARVGVSRQLRPGTRLLADAGKENNYLPDGTVEKLGATFWDVGFEWANPLNSVKLLVGHRFYGPSYQFSWTHFAALLTTELSYVEMPTDLNRQLLGGSLGVTGTTFPVIGLQQFPSLLEQRVYLMKRAQASATYELPKGQLNLTLYDESRKYFLLNYGREKVESARLSWLFDLGPFTTLTPMVGWQRYRFRNDQVNYTRFAQVALTHRFSRHDFGSVRLRNDSGRAYALAATGRDYRVNVLFVQWTHLF